MGIGGFFKNIGKALVGKSGSSEDKATGLGPSNQAVDRMEIRTPNLEHYFRQGNQEALYDQPWRKPYPDQIYNSIGGNRRFSGTEESAQSIDDPRFNYPGRSPVGTRPPSGGTPPGTRPRTSGLGPRRNRNVMY